MVRVFRICKLENIFVIIIFVNIAWIGRSVILLLSHLSAAFDVVEHLILLQKYSIV